MSQPPGYIRQPWPKSRQSPRHTVEGRLTVHGTTGKVRGWLHDISLEGIGGVVAAELAPDSEVEIEFELDPEHSPLRARATVRFASGFRYGFEFLSITSENLDAVRRYCASAPPMIPDQPS